MSINKFIIPKKWVLSQDKLSTIFYSAFLLFWLVRFFNDLWLFQQLEPPYFYTGYDFSFQLLNQFSLTHLISQSKNLSLLLDLSLVLSAVLALFYKNKKYINIFFSFTLLAYIFIHYGALGAHKHNLTGLWFGSLIFWYKKEINFSTAMNALRFYAIYAYASAGFWKFYRDSYTYDYFFSTILKSHNALFMHSNPLHFKTQLIEFILNHASLGDFLFQLMTMGEFIFIIALFTRVFDKYLAYFAISFHLVSLFLVNVYFLEFSLVLLPFLFKTKNSNSNLILFSAWRNSKVMFAISIFFIISHVYYFDKSIKVIKFNKYEHTLYYGAYPIQNYMMYSYPYHSETFDDYHIYINGKLLIQHTWLPIKSEQFEGNIIEYEKLIETDFIDLQKKKSSDKLAWFFKKNNCKVNQEAYKNWILNKTAALTKSNVEDIEIYKVTFQFENNKCKLIQKERVL